MSQGLSLTFQLLTTIQQFSGISILIAYIVKIFDEVFKSESVAPDCVGVNLTEVTKKSGTFYSDPSVAKICRFFEVRTSVGLSGVDFKKDSKDK